LISAEEELIDQFQHEIPLSIGDELKALLSSFSGKDDSFYVLLINDHTVAIDRAMSQLQEDNIPDRHVIQIPQVKTFVYYFLPIYKAFHFLQTGCCSLY
jgi:hypothetical protein